jgi:hypothetical protein
MRLAPPYKAARAEAACRPKVQSQIQAKGRINRPFTMLR